MKKFIKLVGSNAMGDNSSKYLDWYCDHVSILFRDPGMLAATLYRLTHPPTGDEPQYVCLYTFQDESDFEAFSGGAARQAASIVREQGWGKTRAQVTHRGEYTRAFQRTIGHAYPSVVDLRALQSNTHDADAMMRYVDSCMQTIIVQHGGRIEIMQPAAGCDHWLLLHTTGHPHHDDASVQPLPAPACPDALPPLALQTCWAGKYVQIAQWSR